MKLIIQSTSWFKTQVYVSFAIHIDRNIRQNIWNFIHYKEKPVSLLQASVILDNGLPFFTKYKIQCQ